MDTSLYTFTHSAAFSMSNMKLLWQHKARLMEERASFERNFTSIIRNAGYKVFIKAMSENARHRRWCDACERRFEFECIGDGPLPVGSIQILDRIPDVIETPKAVVRSEGVKRQAVRRKSNTQKGGEAARRKIVCQSGVHIVNRELRDEHQRQCAKKRIKALAKSVSKEVREAAVRAARDKRNPAHYEVEPQSGKVVGVVAAAAAATLVGIFKLRGAVKDIYNDVKNKVVDFFKQLKRRLGHFLAVTLLVAVLWYLSRTHNFAQQGILLIIGSVIGVVCGKDLWNSISDFFREENSDKITEQSGLPLGSASNFAAALLCFQAFKGRSTAMNVTEFTKRISNFDRMSSGLESFTKWVFQVVESFVEWLTSKFGVDYKKRIRTEDAALRDFLRRVDKCVDKHNAEGVTVSNDELNQLVELARQATAFRDMYRGTKLESTITSARASIHNIIHPHLGALNARKNNRPEPTMVVLNGKPGVGKTFLIEAICSALLIKSGFLHKNATRDEVLAHCYQRGTTEYWNGYSGQFATILDDLWQQRPDPTDKDNEFINIIRMIGSWALPLNFADVDSKGKIYFTSKLVLATTNLDGIESEALKVIQDSEAVVRRIKFPYTMRPVASMQIDGKLNYNALEAEAEKCFDAPDPIDRFPWHVWEVARHDFSTGKTSNQYIPMRQLLDMMIEEVRNKSVQFEKHVERKFNFIDGLLAQHNTGEAPIVTSQSGLSIPVDKEYGIMAAAIAAAPGLSAKNKVYLYSAISAGTFISKNLESISKHAGWFKEADAARKSVMADKDADYKDAHSVRNNMRAALLIVGGSAISVVITAAIIAIVKALVSFVRNIFGLKKQKKQDPETQSNRNAHIRAQSDDRPCASLIYDNTYRAHVSQLDGTELVLGQILFVVSDMAIQPNHYQMHVAESLRKGVVLDSTKVEFTSCANAEHKFSMTVARFLAMKRYSQPDRDLDIVMYEDVRAHRNIVSKFVLEKEVESLGGAASVLEIARTSARSLGQPYYHPITLNTVKLGKDLHYEGRRLERYVKYNAPTVRGDCGAPLTRLCERRSNGGVCFGLHVAGCTAYEEGYATLVTRELVESMVRKFNVIRDDFHQDLEQRGIVTTQSQALPFTETGSFLPLCIIETPVTIAPFSKIYKVDSTYGAFGPYDCRPAHLSPVFRNGTVVYPMENAVKPYSSPLMIYDQPWLPECVYQSVRTTVDVTRDCSRRIYSFEEAVLGVPSEKFRSIPRSTASGFPYVLHCKNGKKDFFGDGADYDLTTPAAKALEERVEYIVDRAKQGVRLAHVFVDFLKDEIRTDAKVQAVATRLISSAPLDYTIAWRRYFGAFSSAVMRNHTRTGMAPGICTYTDWDMLRTHLASKGEKVFDGDFKAFDSSEQPTIHRYILDEINRWYDDGAENARVREVLWLDLVHSRHIGGKGRDQRHIYQWNKSLPSGHPFTTIINSIYSMVMLVGAYYSLTGKFNFWQHVSPITYGDDNACNVDDATAEIFNQITVADALKREFGVTYTPGRKDGVWVPTCDITDITFLKRGFRFEQNVGWCCPLELDSFYYTCYYNKNKKDEKKILNDVLENTLFELSMHSQETWDVRAPPVIKLMARLGFTPQHKPVRGSYLQELRSRGDLWY